MSKPFLALGLSCFLALNGSCCLMADWAGCYPEKNIVSLDFATPDKTFEVFKTAVLNNDARIIYLCLSRGFKKRQNLDAFATEIAWQRIVAKYPMVRSLFRAEIKEKNVLSRDYAAFTLTLEGREFKVSFKAEPCVLVKVLENQADGTLASKPVVADDLTHGIPELIERTRNGLILRLENPDWKEDLKQMDLENISIISVGKEWKIDSLGKL